MQAKEYLSLYKIYDSELRDYDLELEAIRTRLEGLSAIDYAKDKIQTSPSGDDAMINGINRMMEIRNKITEQSAQLIETRHEITRRIHRIQNATYIDILVFHYILFLSWEQIAVKLSYNYDYTIQLHGYALKAFEKENPDILEKT